MIDNDRLGDWSPEKDSDNTDEEKTKVFAAKSTKIDLSNENNIQLSPKGEVNSGGYIPRRDPEGDSCFSIYQIRWIKIASSISSKTFAKRRAIIIISIYQISG